MSSGATPRGESPLVRFYSGTGTDHRGRHFDEILAWDDGRLEAVHDYIQWLFPLDEPSGVNPWAPLVTDQDCRAFLRDPMLAANLRRAFARMLAFYGFAFPAGVGSGRITRSGSWARRAPVWLYPGSHNYLRLTRIIKSVKLLGLPDLGRSLYDVLIQLSREMDSDAIGDTTLEYWRRAAGA